MAWNVDWSFHVVHPSASKIVAISFIGKVNISPGSSSWIIRCLAILRSGHFPHGYGHWLRTLIPLSWIYANTSRGWTVWVLEYKNLFHRLGTFAAKGLSTFPSNLIRVRRKKFKRTTSGRQISISTFGMSSRPRVGHYRLHVPIRRSSRSKGLTAVWT